MNGADDSLLLVSHVLEHSDDILGHEGVQTGGGLVAEHHGGVGQDLARAESMRRVRKLTKSSEYTTLKSKLCARRR